MSDGCSDMAYEQRAQRGMYDASRGVLAPDNSAMRPLMPHNACMGCANEHAKAAECDACIRWRGDRADLWRSRK
jgi:hypothetical protein